MAITEHLYSPVQTKYLQLSQLYHEGGTEPPSRLAPEPGLSMSGQKYLMYSTGGGEGPHIPIPPESDTPSLYCTNSHLLTRSASVAHHSLFHLQS